MALRVGIQGEAKGGAIQVRTEVFGLPELERALRRYGEKAEKALAGALYREGEAIMYDAKQLCPVNKDPKAGSAGTLRASGFVKRPEIAANGEIFVEEGFGGPSAPYALRQHEDLTYRHNPGMTAKFLEFPYRLAVRDMDKRLAAEITERVR